ncbi:MAG: hypothetical protein ACI89Z_001374 [Porticoccus sp.]|jgi:hypothetical protein
MKLRLGSIRPLYDMPSVDKITAHPLGANNNAEQEVQDDQ